nr:lysine histidine transporter 1-like [Nicotiana tomentosiformis]
MTYSAIAWTVSLKELGKSEREVSYGPKSEKTLDNVFMFLSELGNVAFAYAGHNVVLEIQATIPSTEDAPSKKAMWKAAILSMTYSAIAWTVSLKELGKSEREVSYGPKSEKISDNVFMFLSALGNVAFAYAGHNVVLEIQATIPSTEDAPSKKAMWKGVFTAYIIVALCYLPVAFIGYWVFGNGVDDNILLTLHRPTWLIATANIFVVAHVIGSYQVSFAIFNYSQSSL